MSDNRRNFIKKSALLGLGGLAGSLLGKNKLDNLEKVSREIVSANEPAFSLPALPYAFEALEPFIDRETMEIHHGKHHQAYVDKLNSANLSGVDLKLSDADKCRKIDEKSPAVLRNNLGGHFNHTFFWNSLAPVSPESKSYFMDKKVLPDNAAPKTLELQAGTATTQPAPPLILAINSAFVSVPAFKKEFTEKAMKLFGSGWCWLIKDEKGSLKICTTANQDNPLMKVSNEKGTPILALDLWEHAYYLKYQNKRAEYINNWWNVVNFDKAEELYIAG